MMKRGEKYARKDWTDYTGAGGKPADRILQMLEPYKGKFNKDNG